MGRRGAETPLYPEAKTEKEMSRAFFAHDDKGQK
jgi:hypothetical protein